MNDPASDTRTDEQKRKGQLFVLRVIWFAMVMGLVSFMALQVGNARRTPMPNANAQAELAIQIFAGSAFAGFVLRRLIHRRDSQGTVPADKYFLGYLLYYVLLEGPTFFSLLSLSSHSPRWHWYVPALSLALFAINFPMGSGMAPAASELEPPPAS